jgi:predicted SAM-dependent methyltransferase
MLRYRRLKDGLLPPDTVARRVYDRVTWAIKRQATGAVRAWHPNGSNGAVPPPPQLGRNDKALFAVDRAGVGLEIGPSFSPIAPRSAGFRVEVLDHATAAALREKYRNEPNVDIARIEEVDHVWRGEPLDELVGTGRYAWIIASHVVEHIPDLVSWLQELTRLLAPGGVISLIVPDGRYCFDHFRWPSTTGDVLQGFVERRRRHTPGTVFDHFAQFVTRAGMVSWNAETPGPFAYRYSFDDASRSFAQAQSSDDYLDVHCWRFTPASFRLLLTELRLLGLIELEVACAFPTEGCEFFVTLRRASQPPGSVDRLALQRQIAAELVESLKETSSHA